MTAPQDEWVDDRVQRPLQRRFTIIPSSSGEELRVHVDGTPGWVTRTTYVLLEDPPRVQVRNIDTAPAHQMQGHGTAALAYLIDHYKDRRLVYWPLRANTPYVERLYESARRRGLAVHSRDCFLNGTGCGCGLEEPDPDAVD